MEITLIEQRKVECEYQFTGTDAIIDHPKYGRLFICDGFGGMDELRGGAIRWEHGMAIKLLPGDTLDVLHANNASILFYARIGDDNSRPVLPWTGMMVAAVARTAGL